jgi:hypothetical protein
MANDQTQDPGPSHDSQPLKDVSDAAKKFAAEAEAKLKGLGKH